MTNDESQGFIPTGGIDNTVLMDSEDSAFKLGVKAGLSRRIMFQNLFFPWLSNSSNSLFLRLPTRGWLTTKEPFRVFSPFVPIRTSIFQKRFLPS